MCQTLTAEVDAEVDGYPNYRLYSFFCWLDNDQPWRKAEVEALDRATRSAVASRLFTPGGWAAVRSFYRNAELHHRTCEHGDKLTPGDWDLMNSEITQRERALATDRAEAIAAEIKRTTQPAPYPLPPANFFTLADKARAELNRQCEMTPHNPQFRRALVDRARAKGLLYGPSPKLSHASIDLLQGRAILVTLFSGEVVEIKPGDQVKEIWRDRWRTVLHAWSSERGGALIQVGDDNRRTGKDFVHEYLDYSGNAGLHHGRYYQIAGVRPAPKEFTHGRAGIARDSALRAVGTIAQEE